MKNYTAALVNTGKPKFSFKSLLFGNVAAKNNYYSARHRTDDIYMLWIESNRFGHTYCFPCVLDEQGDPMIYYTGKKNIMKNNALIQRWNLFAIPSTFERDFTFTELSVNDFYTEYNGYKSREADKELAESEQAAETADCSEESTPAEEKE